MTRAEHLGAAKNIALICASIAVVASSSVDIYSRLHVGNPPAPAIAQRPAPPGFRPGARAPAVPGLDYARSDKTLVMFLSTSCKYCQMSVPFYNELGRMLGTANAQRRLVAVFPQAADEVGRFRAREKLDIETIVDTPLAELGVPSTPTLLLVAKDGTVIRSWVGAPQAQVKEAIAAALIKG